MFTVRIPGLGPGRQVRLLVCGGRDYDDVDHLETTLDEFKKFVEAAGATIEVVIHGKQTGADTLAGEWAKKHDILVLEFPMDKQKYGSSAGPIRNEQMLREGDPDFVLAFPGGPGTRNMVLLAIENHIPYEIC